MSQAHSRCLGHAVMLGTELPLGAHTLGPRGASTHLLVNEPQRVLDVRALEGDGWGGALEQLHEQVVEEPDWGEDHVAQLQ